MLRARTAACLLPLVAAGCRGVLGIDPIELELDSSPTSTTTTTTDATGGGGGASCAADLSSDPLHCGACGHDCLGGACIDARCRPTVVVDDPDSAINDFAIANGWIAWTDYSPHGGVKARRLTGGETTVVSSGFGGPGNGQVWARAIAAQPIGDSNDVAVFTAFFADHPAADAGLWRFVLDGEGGVVASDQVAPESAWHGVTNLTSEPGWAYFLNEFDSVPIGRASATGDTVEPLYDTAKPDPLYDAPSGVAFDADYVYASFNSLGTIVRVAKDGSKVDEIVTGAGLVRAVIVDDAYAYWEVDEPSGPSVWRKAKTGVGAVQQLGRGSPSLPTCLSLAVDGPWLYFAQFDFGTPDAGLVLRVRTDGSSDQPEVVADGLGQPTALAFSDGALLWADTGQRVIHRMARPLP